MPMEGIELILVFFDSQVVMHDTWRLILAVIGSLCKNVRRCLHYVQKNENKTGHPYGCPGKSYLPFSVFGASD